MMKTTSGAGRPDFGMPLAEHKDWCSIHRATIEMKMKAAASQ